MSARRMGRWLLAMAAMLAALGSFGASAASAQRTRHHNSARAAVRCEGTRFQGPGSKKKSTPT
jgi:hypothetical protein